MENKNNAVVTKKNRLPLKPLLGLILLPAACLALNEALFFAAAQFAGESLGDYIDPLVSILCALLCLFVHRASFAGKFNGSLKLAGCKKGLFLLLSFLPCVIPNFIHADYSVLTADVVLYTFAFALGTGLFEETAFRALSGSNFMRAWHDEKLIVPAVMLTSVVFGLAHLMNMNQGAGLGATVTQAVYAIGFGVIFAAVYFRCGSLIPAILAHTLVDFTADLKMYGLEADPFAVSSFDWSMLIAAGLGIAMVVVGLYYVRPAKRAEILDLWAEKWSLNETDGLAEDASAD